MDQITITDAHMKVYSELSNEEKTDVFDAANLDPYTSDILNETLNIPDDAVGENRDMYEYDFATILRIRQAKFLFVDFYIECGTNYSIVIFTDGLITGYVKDGSGKICAWVNDNYTYVCHDKKTENVLRSLIAHFIENGVCDNIDEFRERYCNEELVKAAR